MSSLDVSGVTDIHHDTDPLDCASKYAFRWENQGVQDFPRRDYCSYIRVSRVSAETYLHNIQIKESSSEVAKSEQIQRLK